MNLALCSIERNDATEMLKARLCPGFLFSGEFLLLILDYNTPHML